MKSEVFDLGLELSCPFLCLICPFPCEHPHQLLHDSTARIAHAAGYCLN
jgi:hypothetical protein